jgi:aldehyde dehydrogenase
MPLATSRRIAKIAFTGSTATGRVIAQAAATSLIPATLELGGKSPTSSSRTSWPPTTPSSTRLSKAWCCSPSTRAKCTCPSRALIQESIYDRSWKGHGPRQGHQAAQPLDTDSMMGAQASQDQLSKIMSYMEIGRQEGAECLIGGDRTHMDGDLAGGYYIQPTLFKGHNKMRVFQEEIFGPVLAVTTFKDEAEALAIANDTRTASAPACGAVTAAAPTAWAATSRPAACGPTATTPTRPTPPSAATRNPASAAKPTR